MIKNPELAAQIDAALNNGKITGNEAFYLHVLRNVELPRCLGKYDQTSPDCQRQDISVCRLCKKIS